LTSNTQRSPLFFFLFFNRYHLLSHNLINWTLRDLTTSPPSSLFLLCILGMGQNRGIRKIPGWTWSSLLLLFPLPTPLRRLGGFLQSSFPSFSFPTLRGPRFGRTGYEGLELSPSPSPFPFSFQQLDEESTMAKLRSKRG